MNGVEILATEQVATAFGFDWVLFILFGALLGLVCGTISWLVAEECNFSNLATGISVCFGITIGLVVAGLLCSASETGAPTEFETHYKVTLSDEVSMNEFLERYEIVDQDGKIFIVREVE